MPWSRALSGSLDVQVDDVEVLDPIETSVDDSMESESVISVDVENFSDTPDNATFPVGSGSDINHLDVEVNNDDDEIFAIDNTEVIDASDNETGDQAFDIPRPSTSRPRPELRRKRSIVNTNRGRAADKKDHNHNERRDQVGNDESDDSSSDAVMFGDELIRKKLSLVKASKRPLVAFCDSTAAKKSRSSDLSVPAAGSQGFADTASHPVGEASHPVGEASHPVGEASHPVGEASHGTIQDLLGEIARLRQELASSNNASPKYESLIAVLQAKVECPVCYEVPKQAPVPVCSNGHVVCQTCKRDLCPTCRVRMGVATSVLAVTVIENIPHPCQFQLHGCQETCSLRILPSHQAACKYRTVKCPNINCDQRVSLSELINHTLGRCVRYGTFFSNLAHNYTVSAIMVDDNRRNFARKPDSIEFDGKNFFFKLIRKSSVSMWYFYVQMAGGEEEAKLYTVTIHVFKTSAGVDGKNSHRFIGDVCPIDMEGLDTAAEAGYCLVATDAQMKKLLTEGLAGGDKQYSFSVKVKIEVEELTSSQAENPTRMIQTGGSGGDEASSDQTDREGLRIIRRGRELSPLNLAQNSSQTLPRPSSPICSRTAAGPSGPRPRRPILYLNTSSDTTSDEELVQAVAGVPSGTRVFRPRRHS